MSALLDEVDQEIEARRKTNEVSSQDLVNGTLSNGDALKPQDTEEQPTVKVLGMEMTASCEGGKKWSRPESPVLPTSPPPPAEPVPPPQEIYLEGALPAQSHLLVADSATEPQPNVGEDPAVVLAGKMTLSVISLDSSDNGADEITDVKPEEQQIFLSEEPVSLSEDKLASLEPELIGLESEIPDKIEEAIRESESPLKIPETEAEEQKISLAEEPVTADQKTIEIVTQLKEEVEQGIQRSQTEEPIAEPVNEFGEEIEQIIKESETAQEEPIVKPVLKGEEEIKQLIKKSEVSEDSLIEQIIKESETAQEEPIVEPVIKRGEETEQLIKKSEVTEEEPVTESVVKFKEVEEVEKPTEEPTVKFKEEIYDDDDEVEEIEVEQIEMEVEDLIKEAIENVEQRESINLQLKELRERGLLDLENEIEPEVSKVDEPFSQNISKLDENQTGSNFHEVEKLIEEANRIENENLNPTKKDENLYEKIIDEVKTDQKIDNSLAKDVEKRISEDTEAKDSNLIEEVNIQKESHDTDDGKSSEILSDEVEVGTDEELEEVEEIVYGSSEEESENEGEETELNLNRTEPSGIERVNGEGSEGIIEESKYTTVSSATAAENDISEEEVTDEDVDDEEEVIEIEEEVEDEEEVADDGNNINHLSGESEPEA